MRSSTKLPLVTSLIILLAACSGCELRPEHVSDEEPDTYGLWEVGHRSFTARDETRDNRPLKIDVWYPVDPDKDMGFLDIYPLLGPIGLTADIAMMRKPVSRVPGRNLVVFSHGYRSTNLQSTPLMEVLAS